MAIEQLIAQYNRQLAAANRANRKRFRRAMQLSKRTGRRSIEEARRGGKAERGNIYQDLISRGMGSTSLVSSLRQRSRESEGRNIGDIREGMAQQRIDLLAAREDRPPDFGPYAALIGQFAQAKGAKPPSVWEQLLMGVGGAAAGGIGAGIGRGVGGLIEKIF
jgi:hypothetical protein